MARAPRSSAQPDLLWQHGTITEVAKGRIRVRLDSVRHCQPCLRGEGCGAGVFSRLFSSRGSDVWLPGSSDLKQGQAVRIGVRERELVLTAAVLYALPVLLFILAAVAAAKVLDGPLAQDLGGLLAGLLAAGAALLGIGRWRLRWLNPSVESLSCSGGCNGLESNEG